MTLNGELLTPKGEIARDATHSPFLNSRFAYRYTNDANNPEKVFVDLLQEGASEPTYYMIFVLKGIAELADINSGKVYARLESQQQNLFCVQPSTDHLILSGSQDDEIFFINISSTFLRKYLPDNHPASRRLSKKIEKGCRASLFDENIHLDPETNAVLQGIGQLSFPKLSAQLIFEAKTIKLFALQISQFEQLQSSTQFSALKKEELERMHQAREILLNYEGERLSLRTLAHLVGTNEFTLKRDFKLAFGNTVYGYLNQHKMELAKTMLIREDMTISEISAKMGYKYPTHFSTAFKKYFGYLPNKIRSGKLSLLLFSGEIITGFDHILYHLG